MADHQTTLSDVISTLHLALRDLERNEEQWDETDEAAYDEMADAYRSLSAAEYRRAASREAADG